jgi:hypothetical protein
MNAMLPGVLRLPSCLAVLLPWRLSCHLATLHHERAVTGPRHDRGIMSEPSPAALRPCHHLPACVAASVRALRSLRPCVRPSIERTRVYTFKLCERSHALALRLMYSRVLRLMYSRVLISFMHSRFKSSMSIQIVLECPVSLPR